MVNFNKIISGDTPVLVDFYTNTCDPRDMLTPVLSQVQENLGKRVEILQFEVDNNKTIATTYDEQSISTMLLFQDGEIKWRSSSVVTNAEIVSAIIKNID
ncbi:MAG TPA: thiol reductase thioredoxin [Flavobacteriaceae bacterium]|nr:thiol reductase thioredoxin [Flavobacteriaceae bacterium]MAY53569.1 thiol reductase thioredoxin [Flavobacteriaceae bacterium]HBR55539.1 thiol reductase thioredoxin [Flavobacteriaceae bacterium]HIB48941.1 thiol reductase thioredoxin [Flavobacteriaceae bacterium]HIN97851.1 thiol reductase thioredoxin [Flavobacteriaceae bacterium]|tara:strand:- start:994 stop:1293 length:300 start_codon:yes stop_codon:yes gene_type:complete